MLDKSVLDKKAFEMSQAEKEEAYLDMMTALTRFHRKRCALYDRFAGVFGCPEGSRFSSLDQVPYLPVSAFKAFELKSIPDEDVFKVLTSSGTSGQAVSRIFLDAQTSADQQVVLAKIVSDFIGGDRCPMLIVDSPAVFKDRQMFSARGAGILGFSVFASERCFALDQDMQPDLKAVEAFLKKHEGHRILVFGFTYILWKHLVGALAASGMRLHIDDGMLIHGGGWKKLASEAVDQESFKETVRDLTGIERVSQYYGMAEQTGSIFMECECGHLHASTWSEILFRDPLDHHPLGQGETGLIQVMTPLAVSYPGHSLLTEDMGTWLGTDDCPCGRKGKYFSVTGRIPKAEVRGCSDTYEG